MIVIGRSGQCQSTRCHNLVLQRFVPENPTNSYWLGASCWPGHFVPGVSWHELLVVATRRGQSGKRSNGWERRDMQCLPLHKSK
eukprot:455786-Pelagomonas_calceolata.AAC.2